MIMNSTKKLTLNTPYSKITKALWQAKKVNSEKEKENIKLQTKLNHLQSRFIAQPKKQRCKIQAKYQNLILKLKQQTKWIKETIAMIEERNYQELKMQVKKLETKINIDTEKALQYEKKLKKLSKKYQKIQINVNTDKKDIYEKDCQNINELELQKAEMQESIQQKQKQLAQVQCRNNFLNREIIQLLAIKNKLRMQVKQLKSQDCKLSFCKSVPVSDLLQKK